MSTTGTYVAVRPTKESLLKIQKWAEINEIKVDDDLHVTLLYSRVPVPIVPLERIFVALPAGMDIYGDCLVLRLTSRSLQNRHKEFRALGGTHDYDAYNPHITLQAGTELRTQDVSPIDFSIELHEEYTEALQL